MLGNGDMEFELTDSGRKWSFSRPLWIMVERRAGMGTWPGLGQAGILA